MLLFHGSPFEFERPSLSRSRGLRDFGRGVYLAEDERDSLGCCLKGSRGVGFLYAYEVDEGALLSMPGAVSFDAPDRRWLRLVYECRTGLPLVPDPPVVVGPTAGHDVCRIFRRIRRDGTPFGECEEELARGIVTDRFGTQWCLRSQEAVEMLELVDVEEIRGGDDGEWGF